MTHQHLSDSPVTAQSYGLLFPELPPLDTDESFIQRLGNVGGPCDGSQMPDPERDDAREAAGWPFFGQYVAHDITADRSALALHADIDALRNARRQKIDLEGLYGAGGPVGDPFLYDNRDYATLLTGNNDLLRNGQGTAIIGDPRNDSHLFVSQLHLLMARFHNAVVAQGVDFATAQRRVRWHYQWVVLHDFMPRVIGTALAAELVDTGPKYYNPMHEPYVPLEFAAAAYRYGHGQIRDRYQFNAQTAPAPMFPDLIGFRPVVPAHVIDWAYLFDVPGRPRAPRARKIDGRLPRSLMRLPVAISGAVAAPAYSALSVRDLQRGQACGLASGEAIARHLGVEPLTPEQVGLAAMGWSGETPLWYYVLKEAAVRGNGDQLGPVGGRIVGEVLIGLLDHDPESFRVANPTWKPTLPSTTPGEFTIADLVAFATRSGSR